MSDSRDRIARLICVALFGLTLLGSTGCTTVLKQAYYEVRGAQGELRFIDQPMPSEIRQCNSVNIEPATTDLGPVMCPPELQEAYVDAAHAALTAEDTLWPGGEPAMTVSGRIVYFQKKGILSASQLITRIKFETGGREVGDALLVVESKSFRKGDEKAIAEAGVQTLMKYLNSVRFPEAEEQKKE